MRCRRGDWGWRCGGVRRPARGRGAWSELRRGRVEGLVWKCEVALSLMLDRGGGKRRGVLMALLGQRMLDGVCLPVRRPVRTYSPDQCRWWRGRTVARPLCWPLILSVGGDHACRRSLEEGRSIAWVLASALRLAVLGVCHRMTRARFDVVLAVVDGKIARVSNPLRRHLLRVVSVVAMVADPAAVGRGCEAGMKALLGLVAEQIAHQTRVVVVDSPN